MKKSLLFIGTTRGTGMLVLLLFLSLFTSYSYAQVTTYTFTNAGATGRLGPSQAQINAAYLATNLNGSVTSVAGIQTISVPSSGLYRIEVLGASGGSINPTHSGYGARVIGDVNLTGGSVLQVLVGQMGSSYCTSNSDGGGGGSFVVANNVLLFAAGGGGGGAQSSIPGKDASITQAVVNGSQSQFGSSGASYTVNGVHFNYAVYTTVAQAFTNGGNGQAGGQAPGWPGTIYGEGGFGGGGSSCSCSTGGGGGGGGFVGGGGGGGSYTSGYGGSSYLINTAVNTASNVLSTLGHGRVIITRLCNITLGTNTGLSILCQGSSITLTTNAISSYTWSTGSNAASILVSPAVTTTYSLTAMSPSNCITSAAITITVSPSAPVLTVTASSPSVCLGNTVSILASGALTYTWSGGITNGVAFSPTTTTTYSVQGQNGCGITSSVTTISIAPLPVIGIVSPTLICAATTATLSGGGATTYTWMPGNIVGSSVLVSPQVSTTYTVTGGTGNCIGINTVNLATNPNPTVTVSSTHFSICAGESATLTATGAIGYTWTPGGTGSSIVVSPIIPTGYNVVGVNSFGCYANANIPVIAYAGPNMNIAASTTLVCTGGSVSLNASGATTYSWSTGATTPVTVINPVSSAVYTVVGSTPNSPCATTKTVQVDVFTATISVSSPTAICIGESTTLNASGATTYNWSNGGIGSNVTVNPTTSTGYTVNGISTVGGTTCSSTGTTMVTVNPLPTVTASSTRTNICRFEFANIIAGGASTYSWSNASTASSIAVNPNTNTTYTVIGTDANGCKASASIQIKVYQCVGINETAAASNVLQIYPNPSTGEFNISASQEMHLELVNELGQLVREVNLTKENQYIANIKDLASGIYFVKGEGISKKIIVEND